MPYQTFFVSDKCRFISLGTYNKHIFHKNLIKTVPIQHHSNLSRKYCIVENSWIKSFPGIYIFQNTMVGGGGMAGGGKK